MSASTASAHRALWPPVRPGASRCLMQGARAPPWTPTNPSAMANSLHRITAAPAPAPLSIAYAPRGQAAPPRTLPHYIPPYTLPHPPPAGAPLWALQAGRPPMRRDQTASLTSPYQGVLPRAPSEPGALASRTPDADPTPLALAHPGAGAPFLPRASSAPTPPHPTPRPGGSSHNAYRTRARESSPSTRACARRSSAFLPPHAAAVSPPLACLGRGRGQWPARRVLPTPAASRPLLWPPKPAPPAQQEALRSGPPPRLAITPPSAPRLQNDPTSHPGSQRSSPRTRTLGDPSPSPPSARCPPPPLPHSPSSSTYPSPHPHYFPAPPVPAESSTQQSPHLSPDFL
ncbi:hypothetical protein J1605_010410 [Eschrichtius robustus]|uniref:Uncharacterized protein n=1 Tax=Eschrichtius robustus TaxID=9764 RepID=A0AB34GTY8_ESCRO|nr:hypothetical protein J1605_010410 [Eschrichtius robustus]